MTLHTPHFIPKTYKNTITPTQLDLECCFPVTTLLSNVRIVFEIKPSPSFSNLRLVLKEEASDYLELETIKNLVRKYSQFINFPIYVWASKVIT